jgi:hypothetical protein
MKNRGVYFVVRDGYRLKENMKYEVHNVRLGGIWLGNCY